MNYEHEKARRHAENALAEVNRHLDRGEVRNPQHYQMLTNMAENATRTLNNLDAMENAAPYRDTNIGYNVKRRYAEDDRRNTIDDLVDAISRVLPRISDDMDWDMQRGVPGTGPYGNPRLRRRGGRYGIGRRADMDDTYNDEGRYADEYDDDAEMARRRYRRRDSRGWFMNDNDDRRMDDVTQAAVNAAADTARRMANDNRQIYPSTPVMPRNADSRRYDDEARNDNTDDRMHRPGPADMRR